MKPPSNIVNGLNRRQFGFGSLAAGAVLASGALPAVAQAGALKIRLGGTGAPSFFGPLLVEKKGILKNYGKSYTVEIVRFPNTSTLAAALALGDLDVGLVNMGPLAQALAGPGYDDLRIIADADQDGHPSGGTNAMLVRKDGPIKTVADLKGKLCMTNIPGSPTDLAVRVMAKREGLEAGKDYTIIYGHNENNLLAEKRVDLIIPHITWGAFRPELAALTNVLFTQREALGITQLHTYCATASFIQKNRAVLVDLLEDMIIGIRWYSDPKNHKEVVEIVARVNEQSTEGWDWVYTNRDQHRDPSLMPNLEALKRNWQVMKEFGLMGVAAVGRKDIDPFKHADLSMVTEAAKRLPKI
jgi:ABC-type nitrate/sulfonate/bicarbonate transport system substrate-binding protein